LEQQTLLILHIQKLRLNPRFKYIPIIVIPEVGTGFNHTVLDHATLSQLSCYTLHQNNGPVPGVRKDHPLTQEYVLAGVDIIHGLRFVLEKEWVTVYGHNGNRNTHALLTEMKNQLSRYGRDEHGKLTGKMGGQFHDDLSIAFMMLVYWSRCLEQPTRALNPYYDWLQGIKEKEEYIRSLGTDEISVLRDSLAISTSSWAVAAGLNAGGPSVPSTNTRDAVMANLGLRPISNTNRQIFINNGGAEISTSRALTRKRPYDATM
jgi:hypothetical protein